MKMTKQHFELIAETIANLQTETGELTDRETAEIIGNGTDEWIAFPTLVREFADLLASTNGMFDRGRFERACNTPNYRAPRNVTRY